MMPLRIKIPKVLKIIAPNCKKKLKVPKCFRGSQRVVSFELYDRLFDCGYLINCANKLNSVGKTISVEQTIV